MTNTPQKKNLLIALLSLLLILFTILPSVTFPHNSIILLVEEEGEPLPCNDAPEKNLPL